MAYNDSCLRNELENRLRFDQILESIRHDHRRRQHNQKLPDPVPVDSFQGLAGQIIASVAGLIQTGVNVISKGFLKSL